MHLAAKCLLTKDEEIDSEESKKKRSEMLSKTNDIIHTLSSDVLKAGHEEHRKREVDTKFKDKRFSKMKHMLEVIHKDYFKQWLTYVPEQKCSKHSEKLSYTYNFHSNND